MLIDVNIEIIIDIEVDAYSLMSFTEAGGV